MAPDSHDRHTPQDGLRTLAARAGLDADPGIAPPLVEPIYQSTVYAYPSLESLDATYRGEHVGFNYYRNGTPNASTLARTIATLEGADAGAVAASGTAAILLGVLAVVSSGDHIVADRNVYGGTSTLLKEELPRMGISATLVDAANPEAVEQAIQPNTKLLLLESLSNPTLRVADLPTLIALGHQHKLTVGVDNTFATPALIQPIGLGADLVFHSLPKYLGGHSAAMGGAVAGRGDLLEVINLKLIHLGGTIGPFDAWLVLNGIKTLGLRMRAHTENAAAVAQFLAGHPLVARVDHPSLPTHPQHDLAARLYPHGTGGMLAFALKGGYDSASQLVKALAGRIPFAPSLADVSTTLSYPANTSHRALTPEARAELGITDGLLRLSVGIEEPHDIIHDLESALAQIKQAPTTAASIGG